MLSKGITLIRIAVQNQYGNQFSISNITITGLSYEAIGIYTECSKCPSVL